MNKSIDEIPEMVKRSIDNIDAAYSQGYYLNAEDISEIIDIAWSASGFEINKRIFMDIVKEVMDHYMDS